MNLREYIDSFPKNERTSVRERIGVACGVTESAVKHWANGNRGIHSKYFKSIISASGNKISIEELLHVADKAA